MLKWQRSIFFKGDYHLPREGNECSPNWHYFPTLCKKELFGHNWEINENPDKRKCCKQCLTIAKERGWVGGDT